MVTICVQITMCHGHGHLLKMNDKIILSVYFMWFYVYFLIKMNSKNFSFSLSAVIVSPATALTFYQCQLEFVKDTVKYLYAS
jgi:hypothetical protein